MVVHVSDITSGEPEAIAATLKRAAKGQASLFLVVCIDDEPGARSRSDTLAAIIDEARHRTNGKTPATAQLCVGDVRMDRDRCEVTRAGRPIQLSPMEYTLLEFFMLHHDRALSEELLMRSVFGKATPKAGRFNTLWVHIHRLRKKIDRPTDAQIIRTIKGRGYILKSPPSSELVASQA
jgi:DNA-binding response OmpR family regulator